MLLPNAATQQTGQVIKSVLENAMTVIKLLAIKTQNAVLEMRH
jgi:hypothetical protein